MPDETPTPPVLETYPLAPDGLTAALRTLDVESWEIAERLKTLGIKGVIGHECACVLAVLIHRMLPGAEMVFVEAEAVRVVGSLRDDFGFDWPVALSGALPDGAQDLVQEFDRGERPELIEEAG